MRLESLRRLFDMPFETFAYNICIETTLSAEQSAHTKEQLEGTVNHEAVFSRK